jgi:PPOX class probable F420-dependent enzyme
VSFRITPLGSPGSASAYAIESRDTATSLASLAPGYRTLLQEARYVILGLADERGRVQLTPMWFRIAPDGERFEVNTLKGRAKDRHMRRDPRVTIHVADPANPYHWVTIYGEVAEVIEESDPERGHLATESIDALSERAIGERPYPRRRPGDVRVLFLVAPVQVVTFGAP